MDLQSLIKVIEKEISEAANNSDELEQNRTVAWKYYNSEPTGTEIDGRSQVVDSTIADSIESVMSQIMPIFNNQDIVQFHSVSSQDELQARIESDACTHIVMNKSNGYLIFQDAIKSALIFRNGIIKIFQRIDYKHRAEKYRNLTEEELMQVAAPTTENEEVEIIDADPLTRTITINRVQKIPKLVIESIPWDRFIFSTDCRKLDLSDVNFVADISYPKRYELIEQGFDKDEVYSLPAISEDTDDSSGSSQTHIEEDTHYSSDPSVDTVKIYNITIRADFDEDGYAELRNIVYGDKIIFENEVAECIPYAVGCAFPVPNRFIGQSFFDKLQQVQDSKTQVQRQYWDNINANNNRRLGIDVKGLHEPDSVLESKPAGVVKCKRPPQDVIMAIPVDDIGPSCVTALDYLDRQRSEKVGASLDMQTKQMQIDNRTAHGAERMISSKEEMSAYILANLCNTLVRNTYLIVHKKLQEMQTNVQYKSEGNWNQTNTGQWLDRDAITVDPGLSKGEKTTRYNALSTTLEHQMNAMQQGQSGILVDMNKLYFTLSEMTKVSSIGHTDNFWINPQTPESQQAQQASQQASQQQQQQQKELQSAQMQLQVAVAQAEMQKAQNGTLKAEIDQLKTILDAKSDADETAFKYDKLFEDNATKLAIEQVKAEQQNAVKEGIDERSTGTTRQ